MSKKKPVEPKQLEELQACRTLVIAADCGDHLGVLFFVEPEDHPSGEPVYQSVRMSCETAALLAIQLNRTVSDLQAEITDMKYQDVGGKHESHPN